MATLTITFTAPSPAPDSYRVRYRKKYASSDPYTFVTAAGSPVVITGLDSNQDYEGRIESVCGDSFSTQVVFSTNQFSSIWSVVDAWLDCEGEVCDGEAIYCDWFEIRRTSDNLLIFRYDHDGSNFYKQGVFATLETGVNYTETASWVCDVSKTDFDKTQISGNSTGSLWFETPGLGLTTVSHSMTFNGRVAGFNNTAAVACYASGVKCDCEGSS